MNHALIIGSNSDIAREAMKKLEGDYRIIQFNRSHGDLSDPATASKIYSILESYQPSLVLHSAGVFGGNELEFEPTFRVNVESAWWPIKYYLDRPPAKLTRIILIGSSCYSHGRMKYILYAASKAALHSIWQGASEAINSNVKLGIIHPVRVNTKMVEKYTHANPDLCLGPEDVADEILKMSVMTQHTHIDMDYKEKLQ